jgi:hypothetical protein
MAAELKISSMSWRLSTHTHIHPHPYTPHTHTTHHTHTQTHHTHTHTHHTHTHTTHTHTYTQHTHTHHTHYTHTHTHTRSVSKLLIVPIFGTDQAMSPSVSSLNIAFPWTNSTGNLEWRPQQTLSFIQLNILYKMKTSLETKQTLY